MCFAQADNGGTVGSMDNWRSQVLLFEHTQDMLETIKLSARVLLSASIGGGEMRIHALGFKPWQSHNCLDQPDHLRKLFSAYAQSSHAAINFYMHPNCFPQGKRCS